MADDTSSTESSAADGPTEASTPSAEPTPVLPSSWAASKRGVKRWSAEARADDPALRIIHAPTKGGIGDGHVFHFLFGLKRSSAIDQAMLEREMSGIADDIEVLRDAGYTVAVDPQATREDFLAAVTSTSDGTEGLTTTGIFWSAHGGPDGGIECCDGSEIHPADVPTGNVSASLRLVIFSACYVGAKANTWRSALGGSALIVGWGKPVTIERAAKFLESDPTTYTDLDDLLARYVLQHGPLPTADESRFSPLSPLRGRAGDLKARVANITTALGAQFRECEDRVEILVPLPAGRRHVVSVFIVESSQPFSEGEPLLAAEGDVGELSTIVDPTMLLSGFSRSGYARVSLVKSDSEMGRIIVQGFLPVVHVRDEDLLTLVYQVAAEADELELRIFGLDHA